MKYDRGGSYSGAVVKFVFLKNTFSGSGMYANGIRKDNNTLLFVR